jgi:hypothetical protein
MVLKLIQYSAGVIGLQTTLTLLEAGYKVSVVAEYLPGDEDAMYTSPWYVVSFSLLLSFIHAYLIHMLSSLFPMYLLGQAYFPCRLHYTHIVQLLLLIYDSGRAQLAAPTQQLNNQKCASGIC